MAPRVPLTFWVSAALILLSIPVLASLDPAAPRTLSTPLGSLPKHLGDWQGEDRFFSDKVNAVLQAEDYISRHYTRRHGGGVWVYVAYWGRQSDSMAAHSPKLCYPGAGWLPIEQGTVTIPLNRGGRSTLQVNRFIFQKGNTKEVVVYWYQTGRRVVTSEYTGKFLLIFDTLWDRRSDVAFVRLSTDLAAEDTRDAMARLQDVVQRLIPHLDATLPE